MEIAMKRSELQAKIHQEDLAIMNQKMKELELQKEREIQDKVKHFESSLHSMKSQV